MKRPSNSKNVCWDRVWAITGIALLMAVAALCLYGIQPLHGCGSDLFSALCSALGSVVVAWSLSSLIFVISLALGLLAVPGLFTSVTRWPPTRWARSIGLSIWGGFSILLLFVLGTVNWSCERMKLRLQWPQVFAELLRRRSWTHRCILRIVQYGRGKGKNVWVVGMLVWAILWVVGGSWAFYTSPPIQELKTMEDSNAYIFEIIYRLFLSLGGSDNLFQGIDAGEDLRLSEALAVWRWFGLVLPLWIGLPPLFSWLLRSCERLTAGYLLSGHYVVLGYGQVGAPLARDILRGGLGDGGSPRVVVIVDNAPRAGDLDAVRRDGAIVIEQDAQDTSVFADVAAHRAAGVLVATGFSSRNIDIAGRLAREIGELRREKGLTGPHSHPRIVPHIAERRLMEWVSSKEGNRWLKGGATGDLDDRVACRPEIWPFSADQSAVRKVLAERPLAAYAALRGVRRPHIVILGFDSVAEWLLPQVLQAALVQRMAGPRVTMIVDTTRGDAEAAAVREALLRKYPFLDRADETRNKLRAHLQIEFDLEGYNFDHMDADLFNLADGLNPDVADLAARLTGDSPPPESEDEYLKELDLGPMGDPVTSIFVCFGDDDRNLDVALRLRTLIDRHRRWLAPMFVRLYQDSGLEDVLSRAERQTNLGRVIDDFGQDEEVCTHAEIFDPPRDKAAREAHLVYELTVRVETLGKQLAKLQDEEQDWAEVAEEWERACRKNDLICPEGVLKSMRDGLAPKPGDVAQWLASPYGMSGVPSESDVSNTVAAGRGEGTLGRLTDQLTGYINGGYGNSDVESCAVRAPQAVENRKRAIEALLRILARGRAPRSSRVKLGDDPWSRLDFEYVVSNRDQVDHLPVKLRRLGYRDCEPVDSTEGTLLGPWPMANVWEGHALAFAIAYAEKRSHDGYCEFEDAYTSVLGGVEPRGMPNAIHIMAECEHDRWMVERSMNGWRYGPVRDNTRRVHPSLLPYGKLAKNPSEKRKDERSALDIRLVLARQQPAREWRPECTVGLVGPEDLTSDQEDALGRALGGHVLEALMALEAQAWKREFAPLWKSAFQDSGAPWKSFALCFLSSLEGGSALKGAQVASEWMCQEERGSRSMRRCFRVVVPRVEPLPDSREQATGSGDGCGERLKGLLAPNVGQQDWWEIELLPEGLPLGALDEGTTLTWKADGTSGIAEARADEEVNESNRRLRRRVREERVEPRVRAYIVECSDWLILVTVEGKTSDSSPDPVQQARAWRMDRDSLRDALKGFTTLGEDRPPQRLDATQAALGEEWCCKQDKPQMLVRRAPDGGMGIEIDREHRLVEITLSAGGESNRERQGQPR